MKQTITLLFAVLVLSSVYTQSLRDLIVSYEAACNEIVLDTFIQRGFEVYAVVPGEYASNANGLIVLQQNHLADTAWQTFTCPEYAMDNRRFYMGQFAPDLSAVHQGYLPSRHEITSFSKAVSVPDSVRVCCIEREVVCEVKRREIKPFSSDFWNFIKNQR